MLLLMSKFQDKGLVDTQLTYFNQVKGLTMLQIYFEEVLYYNNDRSE